MLVHFHRISNPSYNSFKTWERNYEKIVVRFGSSAFFLSLQIPHFKIPTKYDLCALGWTETLDHMLKPFNFYVNAYMFFFQISTHKEVNSNFPQKINQLKIGHFSGSNSLDSTYGEFNQQKFKRIPNVDELAVIFYDEIGMFKHTAFCLKGLIRFLGRLPKSRLSSLYYHWWWWLLLLLRSFQGNWSL